MKVFFKKLIKYTGIILLFLIVLISIIGISIYQYLVQQHKIEGNSVLNIYIENNIPELSQKPSKFESLVLGESAQLTMYDYITIINKASKDPKIKAITFQGNSYISPTASMELANAFLEFRKTGKKIYAYSDYYNQGAYLLSTFSDSIFLNPSGNVDLKGYIVVLSYYKSLLEKLEIDMEIFVAGKYKSFVESFNRTNSSELNKSQYTRYLNGIHEELVTEISKNRGISISAVEKIIGENLGFHSESCLVNDLVDSLLYKTDFNNYIEKKYGIEKEQIISIEKYKKCLDFNSKLKEANIAYVVIEGDITGSSSSASSKNLRKSFEDIRENKNIKTVILRLNTGGGSAFASEDIWHEIEITKAAGKEVISSISSASASGGYYIMCNSDKIFASKSSLTGSIGVFIAFPNINESLSKNLGVDFDMIETGPFASRNMIMVPLDEPEKAQLQKETEMLYNKFLDRVSEGRSLSKSFTDSIAQGHIYIAEDALKIGLVDSILNLREVLEYVQQKNNLSEISIKQYPEIEKKLLDELNYKIQTSLKINNPIINYYNDIENNLNWLFESPIPQARMRDFKID